MYTVESLVADEGFQNFCLGKNSTDEQLWEDVIFSNWTQKETFAKAHDLVQSLVAQQEYKLAPSEAKVLPLTKSAPKSTSTNKWLGAVCIIVCLLIGYGAMEGLRTEDHIYITQSTSAGETREVILPDQSVALLNSNSSVTYLADMEGDRTLQFEGEVFLDIQTTPDLQNFSVKVPHGVIVGTK